MLCVYESPSFSSFKVQIEKKHMISSRQHTKLQYGRVLVSEVTYHSPSPTPFCESCPVGEYLIQNVAERHLRGYMIEVVTMCRLLEEVLKIK